jgi:hypothetical protein
LEEEEKESNKNAKRYNIRKRKYKTVYVSASKIFQLDNIRGTDNVTEAMKRGYKVSIGRSFFEGGGGGGNAPRQNGQGGQEINPTRTTTCNHNLTHRTPNHHNNATNNPGC